MGGAVIELCSLRVNLCAPSISGGGVESRGEMIQLRIKSGERVGSGSVGKHQRIVFANFCGQ